MNSPNLVTAPFDVGICLAGGGDGPNSSTVERAHIAAELYCAGVVKRIVLAGGVPIHQRKPKCAFANEMRMIVRGEGVPETHTAIEIASRTTWEQFWNIQEAELLQTDESALIITPDDYKGYHLKVGQLALGKSFSLIGTDQLTPSVILDSQRSPRRLSHLRPHEPNVWERQATKIIAHGLRPGDPQMKERHAFIYGTEGPVSWLRTNHNMAKLKKKLSAGSASF